MLVAEEAFAVDQDLFLQCDGLSGAPGSPEAGGQIGAARQGVGVLATQKLFITSLRPLLKHDRLTDSPGVLVAGGEVRTSSQGVRMPSVQQPLRRRHLMLPVGDGCCREPVVQVTFACAEKERVPARLPEVLVGQGVEVVGVRAQDRCPGHVVVVFLWPQFQQRVGDCPHQSALVFLREGFACGARGQCVDPHRMVRILTAGGDQAVAVQEPHRSACGHLVHRQGASTLVRAFGGPDCHRTLRSRQGRHTCIRTMFLADTTRDAACPGVGEVDGDSLGLPELLGVSGGVEERGQVECWCGEPDGLSGLCRCQRQQQCRCDVPFVRLPAPSGWQCLAEFLLLVVEVLHVHSAGLVFVDHPCGRVPEGERQMPQHLPDLLHSLVQEVSGVREDKPLPEERRGLGGRVGADVQDVASAAADVGALQPGGDHRPMSHPATALISRFLLFSVTVNAGRRPPAAQSGRFGDIVEDDQPRPAGGGSPVQERPRCGLHVLFGRSWSLDAVCGGRIRAQKLFDPGGVGPQHEVDSGASCVVGEVDGELGLADPAPAGQHLAQHDRTRGALSAVDLFPQVQPGLVRSGQVGDSADEQGPRHFSAGRWRRGVMDVGADGPGLDDGAVDRCF